MTAVKPTMTDAEEAAFMLNASRGMLGARPPVLRCQCKCICATPLTRLWRKGGLCKQCSGRFWIHDPAHGPRQAVTA